ncbi:MAG TPA: DMT family transporter [Alphaproteobacteria bacterium]|nr:DMT family transporter [Micavibrio sp.]MBK9562644.1 DMT family transporter [Micavibrio sp.]HQX26345.1 DMT family transporter [Alphaproteobacteria bacterium]
MSEKSGIPQPIPQAYPPPVPPPPMVERDNIMRGIAYGLAAYLLFGIMQACAKLLMENHNPAEIAFYRNIVAIVPLIIYIAAFKKWHVLKTRKPVALLLRAVVGTIGLIITFAAFQYLPMAETTVILFAGIILTPAVAYFALNEHMGWRRWSAIGIGMVGVILMVRPSGDVALIGVLIAFAAACTHAFTNTMLRYLRSENSLGVTFYFILSGIFIGGLFMPFVGKIPGPDEFLLFLGVGVSAMLAQYLLTSAFRLAPTSLVAMLNYTGLIWATIFDVVIWNYVPGLSVFVGGFIILAANLYIIHRERLAELRSKRKQ